MLVKIFSVVTLISSLWSVSTPALAGSVAGGQYTNIQKYRQAVNSLCTGEVYVVHLWDRENLEYRSYLFRLDSWSDYRTNIELHGSSAGYIKSNRECVQTTKWHKFTVPTPELRIRSATAAEKAFVTGVLKQL
jgi:hypothetical protein